MTGAVFVVEGAALDRATGRWTYWREWASSFDPQSGLCYAFDLGSIADMNEAEALAQAHYRGQHERADLKLLEAWELEVKQ